MCGHVMRGRFTPRCSECGIDFTTAWSPQLRIPVLILITLAFMWMHPAIANIVKRGIWMVVKPLALLIGWASVAVIRSLIFLFIDGPQMIGILLTPDNREGVDIFGIDIENNTKLNAIWSRLHNEEVDFVPGGVFDKKYKPFVPSNKLKLSGARQQDAIARNRRLSC
ncbi:hypothetical protein ColTof4_07169 [Colletotrichum tofieldiae]|uniref:Uncharacterized protein n=1 Tax=Colletotrichum tofieldiae TaxID=708197 RepID=A0A166W085_9PEZI|nr:hypothetical protein CT0861_00607 [Colletotrichum tofieldiae]GKT64771.1 hypothetical protein ColTof3_12110 [Colletotrichum tofieldiae]GKT74746.1 hypothetical protein ColTof4_07169 [Colletotrichum tofieldiae]GKT91937.1 hypothetical protein Ct61P_09787 [Colletotrichum tofieldiae]